MSLPLTASYRVAGLPALLSGARPPPVATVQAAMRGKPSLAKTVEQRKIERENMLLLGQLDRVGVT